jgi:hypothetical protein
MIVSDLLAELRENILHDRSDRTAGTTDLLWSDATLIRYMNEAQRRFARIGLVLRDATTPEVTTVTLVEGQDTYTLHDSVLAVMSVRYSDEELDLTRLDHSTIAGGRQRPVGNAMYDNAQVRLLPPGKPLGYTTDDQVAEDDGGKRSAVHLRVYPTPTADYDALDLRLRVVRLPLDDLTTNLLCVEPEIPSMHHVEMLDWAAYLALRIVDHDAGNPARAHEFRAMFEKSVAMARKEAMRKMFAPTVWSFGRNGFSWEP